MNFKSVAKAAVLVCVIALAGCGGGGSDNASTDIVVTGKVSAPAGVSLTKVTAGKVAAATGLTNKAGVTVVAYFAKDDGTADGGNLASATTDANGAFTLQTPPATTKKIIISVGSGNNKMRNVVTSTTTDITPITEFVTSKVAATGKLNSNFTNEEIIAIMSQANSDAASTDMSSATNISSAMTMLDAGTIASNIDAMVSASNSGTFVAGCGNNVKETGETCDDGNTTAGDGCSASCLSETTAAVCGNGTTETGETCDDGNTVTETCTYGQTSCSVCNATCQTVAGATSYCGDSTTDSSNSETCDDGNTTAGDGCSASCLSETTAAVCGNGTTETGETCDDGNTVTETCTYGQTSCSVCNATCQTVAGSTSYCGDSTTDSSNSETCDDGNATAGDGCSASCQTETTTAVCGNGTTETGETCDDGNTVTETCTYGQTSCSVCSATCQTVAGSTSYCGDSTTDSSNTETCDDGNTTAGDGCSASCQTETAAAVCGNGTTETGETCDDGNTVTETCTYGQTSCTVCNATCQTVAGSTSYCGDSTTDVSNSETCDDGNTTAGDGCSSICESEYLQNEWVTIPAGDFVMGCADADIDCGSSESPKHTVTLSEYKIQKYEVTVSQYVEFLNANGSDICGGSAGSFTCLAYISGGGMQLYGVSYSGSSPASNPGVFSVENGFHNKAVNYVSYYGAKDYCTWLGGRLPTEAEWEKAARGPAPRENIYPWGDTAPDCSLANFNNCESAPVDVDSYPNGISYYGIYNMSGNVAEWVKDLYSSDYYNSSPSVDPQGPTYTGFYDYVFKGFSYSAADTQIRISYRPWALTTGDPLLGFRCAMD